MLKKMILITVLFMACRLLPAPAVSSLYIPMGDSVNSYDRLIQAVLRVECNGDYMAYNAKEEARGPLQIRPIRLNDYNRRTGKSYTLDQMYDFSIAREIFLYYTYGRSFELCAKSWNGSGPMTIDYWKKVCKYL